MFNKLSLLLCLSIAITGFIWRGPYFLWYDNTFFRIFILLSFIFFILYFFINEKLKVKKIDFYVVIFTIIALIYYSLPGVEGSLGFTLGYFAMIIFMLIPDELKQKVFQYFSWLFAISLIPGILLMVLFLIGFDFSFTIIESPSGRFYRQYFGAVALTSHISDLTGFTRLHGMFDEPGVVGTLAALLLIGDNFRIKKNPKNIIILIGGILSLSFAFMVMLIIYIALRMKFRYILFTLLFLLLLSIIIPENNEVINKYVIDRFSIEDNSLKGNNRITSFNTEQQLASFYSSDFKQLFFGKGNKAHLGNNRLFGDSWQFFFYNYGLLGLCILLLGTILYMLFKVQVNIYQSILLALIFFLSFYQRHDIINLHYMILLFGGLANLQHHANGEALRYINKKPVIV